jgi:RNA polymerase sigma factor (TIGR02999 family)
MPDPDQAAPGNEDHLVTQILGRINRLDDTAARELYPLVYAQLRELAEALMRSERSGHTLQPTALANEVYIKMLGANASRLSSRTHFLAVAAQAMRQILVDSARKKNAAKRGGGAAQRLTMTGIPDSKGAVPEVDILALNEALERIESKDRRVASVVELRFFAGLTIAETARVLGVSHSTVEDDWSFARAWLRRELGDRFG